MGIVANEPSMEDILSSIKRIIADGSDRTAAAKPSRRRAVDRDDIGETADNEGLEPLAAGTEEHDPAILELTDMVEDAGADLSDLSDTGVEAPIIPEPAVAVRDTAVEAGAFPMPKDQILSDVSAQAARQSLSQLSSMLVRPQEGESNTLEGLVREMLRPMLKDWLEAQLPDLVESLVKKEIDRIVGRLG